MSFPVMPHADLGEGTPVTVSFTSGQTHTVPAGVTSVDWRLVGRGGGGGGGTASYRGGTGGGPAVLSGTRSVTPGSVFSISGGGGGAGGANNASTASTTNGQAGSSTSLIHAGSTIATAAGGGGGGRVTTTANGVTGTHATPVSAPGYGGTGGRIGFNDPLPGDGPLVTLTYTIY